MAGRQTLDLLIGVRILSPQPYMVPSSSGLGRGPLKAKTRVRFPLGPPIFSRVSGLLMYVPSERDKTVMINLLSLRRII